MSNGKSNKEADRVDFNAMSPVEFLLRFQNHKLCKSRCITEKDGLGVCLSMYPEK